MIAAKCSSQSRELFDTGLIVQQQATWGICTRRAGTLYKARSRLYRSQFLQVNTARHPRQRGKPSCRTGQHGQGGPGQLHEEVEHALHHWHLVATGREDGHLGALMKKKKKRLEKPMKFDERHLRQFLITNFQFHVHQTLRKLHVQRSLQEMIFDNIALHFAGANILENIWNETRTMLQTCDIEKNADI